ncbi:MAG: hypothetical protein V8S22_08250 [Lachnospiraceae bacterium]
MRRICGNCISDSSCFRGGLPEKEPLKQELDFTGNRYAVLMCVFEEREDVEEVLEDVGAGGR